ncbi:MAG: histidine phosphatase family protein [Anaerolineales bacterium]
MKLFLLRHATPDWHRKDIPYDILPGPALLAHGEAEAQALGTFMKSEGLKKIYYSPFERSAQTAKIVATMNQIPCIEEKALAEWRGEDETEAQVRARMLSLLSGLPMRAWKWVPSLLFLMADRSLYYYWS